MNAIGSQTRREGVTGIVKPEIHEARIFASMPPTHTNGIDAHAGAGIAEHEFLRSSILLEHHQFLKDDFIHGNRPSPASLASGDENRPSWKVYMFPLKPENLTPPHARIQSDRDYRADVISPASELRKQSLLFFCGNEPFATRTLFQHANTPHWIRVDQFIIKSHRQNL